jgi:predicted permease
LDLPQGTLDLLLLKAIGLGPQHGWAIAERIQQVSREALKVQQGGIEQIKEECRDARGVMFVQTVVLDLRYGVRALRHAPAFAATALITLALSTAAIPTVFTLGYTLLLRPLPVAAPDRLVSVAATRESAREPRPMSFPDYIAFRDGTRTLAGLAAHYSTAPLFVATRDNAREINGAVVSANFFPLLGIKPSLGRFFLDDEDRVPDRDRVVVISYDLWRTWFEGSPGAIGETMTINGVVFSIVGVAPASFKGLSTNPSQLFIPTMMLGVGYRWCDAALAADCTILDTIGRLAPGRTVGDAAAELRTLAPPAWNRARPGENRAVLVSAVKGVGSERDSTQLVTTLSAVACVLVIVCCANLAGLLMAQGAARTREFAIRMSLGAGRARVIRQFMTESMLLALVGCLAGVLLSRGFIKAIALLFYSMDDEGHPMAYDFSATPGVVVIGVAAALIAGCLFSLLPALRIAGHETSLNLMPRPETTRWSSIRWLLGVQTAVAVALVAIAALLHNSVDVIVQGTTFESSHVALMRLRPRLMGYTPDRAQRMHRVVIQHIASLPGVESVTMIGTGVVLGGGSAQVLVPEHVGERPLLVRYADVAPRYFETLKTRIVNGREFTDQDSLTTTQVAVVNETLLHRLWPDGRAIDASLRVGNTLRRVVGVVQDIALQTRTGAVEPYAYVPFWQNANAIDARLAIRVAGEPSAMLPMLMREVHRVDPDVPIAETITLPMQLEGWVRPLRISAAFGGYAAILAVLLTAVGLYGALAFAVARRTQEIGIRIALGAQRRAVQFLVVRDALRVLVAGAIAGIGLAMAGTRVLNHLLYGSSAVDWLFHAAAGGVVLAVGLFAAWMPARRAAYVEPLVALRHE